MTELLQSDDKVSFFGRAGVTGVGLRFTKMGSEANKVMVGPIDVRFVGTSRELGGDWSCAIVHVPPGESLPMHTHRSPELFHVLSGTVDFATLDEQGNPQVFRAKENDVVSIPSMAPHAWKGIDGPGDKCVMLNCFEQDLVDFFLEAKDLPPTPEAANEAAARHGIEMTGPFPDHIEPHNASGT